jgi:hypothetical protein
VVRSNVLFREAGAMRPASSLLAGLFALAVMLIRGAISKDALRRLASEAIVSPQVGRLG